MPGMIERGWHIIEEWQQSLPRAEVSALFLRVVYVVAFWSLASLIPVGEMLWGADHFTILYDPYPLLGHYAMLLQHEAWRSAYAWFLYPCLGLLAMGVLGYSKAWTRILIWLLFVNLHFGNHEMSNGGWHMLHHALFLSIFFFRTTSQSIWGRMGRLFHNLSFYGVWLLLCMLYLVAGVHKLLGEMWLQGDAVFIILSQENFSHPWILDLLNGNHWVLKWATWSSLVYQLLFSVVIWVRGLRPYLLAFGLCFHLSIAFVVGITDFGLILVACYTIFLPPSSATGINRKLRLPIFSERSRESAT